MTIYSATSIQEKLISSAIDSMQGIAKDSFNRVKQYEENPKLLESGVWYTCDYMAALQKTAQLKKFEELQEEGHFYLGKAPSDYFVHDIGIGNPAFGFYQFSVRPQKKASDAIKAMKEGLSFLECGTVTHLVQYDAILKTIGQEKFDRIFAANSATLLTFTLTKLTDHPLQILTKEKILSSKETVKKGQFCYLKGYDNYLSKHFLGGGLGYNALCIDDTSTKEKYASLGLPAEGYTMEQMKTVFVDQYNLDPNWEDTLGEAVVSAIPEESLATPRKLKDHKITIKDLEQNGGTVSNIVTEFNFDRITTLAECCLEDVEEWMQIWKSYQ